MALALNSHASDSCTEWGRAIRANTATQNLEAALVCKSLSDPVSSVCEQLRARLQTALQGLWGGKIILRAILWWVTITSSSLSSTFSAFAVPGFQLCTCSMLSQAEKQSKTPVELSGYSQGFSWISASSLCTSPAPCSGCDWHPVWHYSSHTATTALSTAWWGHSAPVTTALCHLAVPWAPPGFEWAPLGSLVRPW